MLLLLKEQSTVSVLLMQERSFICTFIQVSSSSAEREPVCSQAYWHFPAAMQSAIACQQASQHAIS